MSYGQDDPHSHFNAGRLAKLIETYWHSRGHTTVRAERFEVWEGTWGVRSNLVAGLPPQYASGGFVKGEGPYVVGEGA